MTKLFWRDDGQEQYEEPSILGLFGFIRTDIDSARLGSSFNETSRVVQHELGTQQCWIIDGWKLYIYR